MEVGFAILEFLDVFALLLRERRERDSLLKQGLELLRMEIDHLLSDFEKTIRVI